MSAVNQTTLGDLALAQGQDENHECHHPEDTSLGHLLSSYWPRIHPQSTRDCLLTRTQSPKAATRLLYTRGPQYTPALGFTALGTVLSMVGECVQGIWLRALLSILKSSVNPREPFNPTEPPFPYFKTRGSNIITSQKPCKDQVR